MGAPLPKNGATEFAVCVALAGAATDVTFGNIIKYVERIGPEYTAMTGHRRDEAQKPELCNTPPTSCGPPRTRTC